MPKLIDTTPWRKAWALLDGQERRNALKVLVIAIVGAMASTAMVASVMPFLSVLADPSRIRSVEPLAWAYERFGFTSDYWFLVALGLASLIVIMIGLLIQMLKIYAIARFTMMRVHSLSCRLMANYLGQPYEYFLNHHSGDMGTRVLAETQEMVQRFLKPAAELVTASLTVVAVVGFLLWVEPVVSLVVFGGLGGIYGMVYAASRLRLARLGRERVVANAERFRLATEALGGVKDIKLLGREADYVDRFSLPSRRMANAQVRMQLIKQIPYHVIQAAALAGGIALCLALLKPADFSDGTGLGVILPLLGVFAFAGQRLMPELGNLYQAAAHIQAGRAAVDLVHADLVDGAAGPQTRRAAHGLGLRENMRLERVSYRYPGSDQAGVTDISLDIRAGEKIGIVGGTGAGKTTLADLFLGLLRPHAGQIVIDGHPLTDENLRAWQRTVGYVPQDIFLIDASVAENIALGVSRSGIEMDRVAYAARIAQIDAFIRGELPEGYDTTVGERGVRLSGGQRQRIGIARALYHDADLIVFDEATSALDSLTEAEVMVAIDTLPGDKTVVMIAHRLSTVQRCDRIVVMDKGRVVGCDAWAALIAQNATLQRIARLRDVA